MITWADLVTALPAGKDRLLSQEPFAISETLADELEKTGFRLLLFQRAVRELYYRSVAGKQPAWIAEWMEQGQPPEVIAAARDPKGRQAPPPGFSAEITLTEGGFAVTRLGHETSDWPVAAALGQVFAGAGYDVLGGAAAPPVSAAALPPELHPQLGLALFRLRPLREFWRRELSERHFFELQKVLPFTWLLHPGPLPRHAVLPELEVHDWREVGEFPAARRALLLQRGREEILASTLTQAAWREALAAAVRGFVQRPATLQRYLAGRETEQPYFEGGHPRTGRGLVRLTACYIFQEGRTKLTAALAKIYPPGQEPPRGDGDAIITAVAVTPDAQ